ncbi:unnamed protein product [Pleuronectes platessa]|uniref:Uncharacterized protein n=1 Tax=Pleuronectes platessa TaxID=8262 RepID=A0A9N7VME1_PLEPL|nr:unnamed protein product [Pleuronectes platessa]
MKTHHFHVTLGRNREEVAEAMKGALQPLISVYTKPILLLLLLFTRTLLTQQSTPVPLPLLSSLTPSLRLSLFLSSSSSYSHIGVHERARLLVARAVEDHSGIAF